MFLILEIVKYQPGNVYTTKELVFGEYSIVSTSTLMGVSHFKCDLRNNTKQIILFGIF